MFFKNIFFYFFCISPVVTSIFGSTSLFSMQTNPHEQDEQKLVAELLRKELNAAKDTAWGISVQRVGDLLDLGAALGFSDTEKIKLLERISKNIKGKQSIKEKNLQTIRMKLRSPLVTMKSTPEVIQYLQKARRRIFPNALSDTTSKAPKRRRILSQADRELTFRIEPISSSSSSSRSSSSSTSVPQINLSDTQQRPTMTPVLLFPSMPYFIQGQQLFQPNQPPSAVIDLTNTPDSLEVAARAVHATNQLSVPPRASNTQTDSNDSISSTSNSSTSESELKAKRRLEKSAEDAGPCKRKLLSPITPFRLVCKFIESQNTPALSDYLASIENNLSALTRLLEYQDPQTQQTIFHTAVLNNSAVAFEQLLTLLDKLKKPNPIEADEIPTILVVPDSNGLSAIDYATAQPNRDILSLIIQHQPQVLFYTGSQGEILLNTILNLLDLDDTGPLATTLLNEQLILVQNALRLNDTQLVERLINFIQNHQYLQNKIDETRDSENSTIGDTQLEPPAEDPVVIPEARPTVAGSSTLSYEQFARLSPPRSPSPLLFWD